MRLIGFSPRRSCHEVTDEVKSIGLLSPTAVCGHTALRGSVLRPHSADLTPPSRLRRAISPKVMRLIGLSPRRSCHEVTDEVKSYGMMLPAAVCGHTALRGSVLRPHSADLTPPSRLRRAISPKVMRLIGLSPRRSCHEVTDEVKSYGMMLPAAVCGHTALRGSVLRPHSADLTPPSRLRRATSSKVEAMCG